MTKKEVVLPHMLPRLTACCFLSRVNHSQQTLWEVARTHQVCAYTTALQATFDNFPMLMQVDVHVHFPQSFWTHAYSSCNTDTIPPTWRWREGNSSLTPKLSAKLCGGEEKRTWCILHAQAWNKPTHLHDRRNKRKYTIVRGDTNITKSYHRRHISPACSQTRTERLCNTEFFQALLAAMWTRLLCWKPQQEYPLLLLRLQISEL